MRLLLVLIFLVPITNSFATNFCEGIDGDKAAIGTRYIVTCETAPETEENILVKYCYLNEQGDAQWSPQHAEFDPEGC